MENSKPTLLTLFRSEGALLAVIPFLASLIAFCFEIGYLKYFGVPADYVEIGFIQIATAMAALIVPVSIFWIYFVQIIKFYESKHTFWHVMGSSMLYSLFPMVAMYFVIDFSEWMIFAALLFLFFVLLNLVPPLFAANKSSYWERVREEQRKMTRVWLAKNPDPVNSLMLYSFPYLCFLQLLDFADIWGIRQQKTRRATGY